RGSGAGNALLSNAVKFCGDQGYGRVHLWTFRGLDAARHLYEKHGFHLTVERAGRQWGAEVFEQRFERGPPADRESPTD
ncbi:MAG: GNAT family N-acetyltransferase, partial [Burkholderiaceae bacterium]